MGRGDWPFPTSVAEIGRRNLADDADAEFARDQRAAAIKAWDTRGRKRDPRRIGKLHRGATEEFGRDAVATINARMVDDVAWAEAAWAAGESPDGLAATYVWRRDRGYSLSSPIDKDFEAATADRSEWSAAKKAAATRRLNAKAAKIAAFDAQRIRPSEDGFYEQVEEAIAVTANNPFVAAAVEKFGEVPVVAGKSDTGHAGQYLGYAIAMYDSMFIPEGVTGPLRKSKISVDHSPSGTLRHEYGHHVHRRAELLYPADTDQFRAAYRRWNPSDIGKGADSDTTRYISGEANGLSTYGQTNVGEAFAETFAMVSHPDFDRSAITDPNLAEMVDIVRRLST